MTKIETTNGTEIYLPAGWRWVRLGDVCEFLDHRRKPVSEAERAKRNEGKGKAELYPYYGAYGLAGWIDDYLFDEPLILLAEDGGAFGSADTPIAYKIEGKAWVNNHAHVLKPRNGVDFDFCLASISIRPDLGQLATGNTRPKLNQAVAAGIPILLPPLSEQRRIAGMLREQMAAVEKARAAAQARLETVKTLPAAFLRHVFNGPEAQAWPRMKFEQVSLLQRGYDLPEPERKPGPYPVVTSSGIVGTHCEFRARGPGVVTGRSGSVGRVHFIEEDFWPHNTALYIKDFMGNNPLYIFYLLQWVNVKTISSGTGVPTLDRKEVHKIMVSHPFLSEQERIVGTLKKQMAAVEKARAAAEEELRTINALPAALLRRAFNGEV
jgi:type I restriction enzyme S subunit